MSISLKVDSVGNTVSFVHEFCFESKSPEKDFIIFDWLYFL